MALLVLPDAWWHCCCCWWWWRRWWCCVLQRGFMWDTERLVAQVAHRSVFMPKLPHLFATCMWVYLRLDGSKRSECLPLVISQISRLRTPRARAMDLGRDLNLRPGFRRVPWPPRSRAHETRLAGGGAKKADVRETFMLYIAI